MIREVTYMNKHELYHNHNYVYLLTSNIINRCGDSLDTILFTWLVSVSYTHLAVRGCKRKTLRTLLDA